MRGEGGEGGAAWSMPSTRRTADDDLFIVRFVFFFLLVDDTSLSLMIDPPWSRVLPLFLSIVAFLSDMRAWSASSLPVGIV